ncbi:MAG: hypothetical protein GVY22_01775 [Gammaproteobacteria bacterium]|jgi:hypothetical protein|nr:hypothetical protein [Gammaproteobacteria bacterium]
MTFAQVRLWNLRWLAGENGGLTALAKRIDRPQPMLSAYIGRNPSKLVGRDFCAYVEQTLELDPLWLDQPHPDLWRNIENPTWRMQVVREMRNPTKRPIHPFPG